MTSTVTRAEFVGGHVGVIVFHILLGLVVWLAATRPRVMGWNSTGVLKGCAVLLVLVSILGLVPIVMDKDYIIQK